MDRGAWQAIVHEVTELDTTEWLSTAKHSCNVSLEKKQQQKTVLIMTFSCLNQTISTACSSGPQPSYLNTPEHITYFDMCQKEVAII